MAEASDYDYSGASTRDRNATIKAMHADGVSMAQLGERFHLSYQRVQQIIKQTTSAKMRDRGPFHCPLCGRRYVYPSGITWHLTRHGWTLSEAQVWRESDELERGVWSEDWR